MLFTHAASSRKGTVLYLHLLVSNIPHDISKTNAARIIKLDIDVP